jgi:hypothetical protein
VDGHHVVMGLMDHELLESWFLSFRIDGSGPKRLQAGSAIYGRRVVRSRYVEHSARPG